MPRAQSQSIQRQQARRKKLRTRLRPAVETKSNKKRGSSRLRIVRQFRLAELLDVDPSTVWRWKKAGLLPPTVEIGGIEGWLEDDLFDVLSKSREGK